MPILDEIYYHLYEGSAEGSKPPVILIHGAGGTHLHWPSEVRRLPGYRVYALDLPGHGKSDGRGHQSIVQYAKPVLEWLEALQIHRAVLVGHSMGAAVALSMALEQPDRVLGLGLVASAARLWVPSDVLDNTASPTTFNRAVEGMVARAFSSHAPQRLTELAAQRMAETRYSVLHGDLLASESLDLTGRLEEILSPAVVICGAEDTITSIRDAQFLADNLPNARLETVPAAGHMVMLEQPQAVTEILMGFLREVSY